MKKIRCSISLSLACILLMPITTADAQKGEQKIVPDTVADPHSKYTAKYEPDAHRHCTAILISSTAALTAKHCGGDKRTTQGGTIYPGESGLKTPFGYMHISEYIPNPKYDLALLKGMTKDQSRAYQYYIRKFKTTVNGYSDDALNGLVGKAAYSYGYPYQYSGYKQYRSDGEIEFYEKSAVLLRTTLPATGGQSGSGVFLKDGEFVGIIITRTSNHRANVLPFTEDIAKWINDNAN